MFFTRKPIKPAPRTTTPAAARPNSVSAGNEASTVLDALGGVLQALARHPLDTETLDAESAKGKITDWTRHATLGAKHPKSAGDPAGAWRRVIGAASCISSASTDEANSSTRSKE